MSSWWSRDIRSVGVTCLRGDAREYYAYGTQYRYYGLNYNPGTTPAFGRLRGVCVSTLTTCGDLDGSASVRLNMAYAYYNNGNMLTRTEGGVTYTQNWTPENRVASITASGVSAVFTYDADNTRVKTVINGTTTVYVGNTYEKNITSGEVTKYYYFGGQRVAMRNNAGARWLHGDNLGSASVATSDVGVAVPNSETRYKPYGERRVLGTGLPTKWTFAGGYDFVASTGLLEFGVRQYDPVIARFISADTIVPGAGTRRRLIGMRTAAGIH